MQINLIKGGTHQDHRGILKFFNDFDMTRIRRFYIVEHVDVTTVRAWQGHQKEQKWFYVTEGSFKIVLVSPDDWRQPSENLAYEEIVLDSKNNEILHIPAGFANGFQALEEPSKLTVYSDVTLEESLNDNFRFSESLWYKW